jgi:GNAT superfamily N-acetyltransferase
MSMMIRIRPFATDDASSVRHLFIRVNRLLAPPAMKEAFERYIHRSLREEIDRIDQYYGERQGGFWVSTWDKKIVGMFGLESSNADAMELRRMYVDPAERRRGIARMMLEYAENVCRQRERLRINLSTSELQRSAIALYRSAGYQLVREEIATVSSNKSLGGGIRRFHFTKHLDPGVSTPARRMP